MSESYDIIEDTTVRAYPTPQTLRVSPFLVQICHRIYGICFTTNFTCVLPWCDVACSARNRLPCASKKIALLPPSVSIALLSINSAPPLSLQAKARLFKTDPQQEINFLNLLEDMQTMANTISVPSGIPRNR